MQLFKDYHLYGNCLTKIGINERKHLIWKFGGIPAIDAGVWNAHRPRIQEIFIRTDKGRSFAIHADDFDQHKRLINLGYGNQYVVDKELWRIKPQPLDTKRND